MSVLSRTPLKTVLFVLAAILMLALILRLPSELAVRLEPVSDQPPDWGQKTVVVAADQRIFTLYAALNAAGFDREYDGIPMTLERQAVRAALSGKDIPSLKRLRPIFDRVKDYHLVVWALQRGAPPGFGRAESGWLVSTRAADFDGLDRALSDFYTEADIPAVWRQVEPAYRAEIERWQPLAEAASQDVQEYLGVSDVPYRQLVVIPNLLDAHYSGNGPQIGEIAYVVAGPTETDQNLQGLIEHEMLHSVIGPMLDRNLQIIPRAQADRLYGVLKEHMPNGYGTWSSTLEETLNRAINLRMLSDEGLRLQQVDQLEAQGFLLIRPLYQWLEEYERSGISFEDYLPTLLDRLNGLNLNSPTGP